LNLPQWRGQLHAHVERAGRFTFGFQGSALLGLHIGDVQIGMQLKSNNAEADVARNWTFAVRENRLTTGASVAETS